MRPSMVTLPETTYHLVNPFEPKTVLSLVTFSYASQVFAPSLYVTGVGAVTFTVTVAVTSSDVSSVKLVAVAVMTAVPGAMA